MNEYVIVDGTFREVDDELMHYGVPGMKWGVRKARELNVKVLERKRKRNKSDYVRKEIDRITKPRGGDDPIKQAKTNKKVYKSNDRKLAYRIAKQKSKLDPNYRNSDEFKNAKREFDKQRTMDAIDKLMEISRTTKDI